MIFGHCKVTPHPLPTEPLLSEPNAPAATITPATRMMIFGHSKVTPYPLTEPLLSEPIAPAATITVTPGVELGTPQASTIKFPNLGLKLSYLASERIY